MESLDGRLVALTESLGGRGWGRGSYLNPNVEDALDELRRQVSAALEEPFWRDIGPLQMVPVSSQVLQRKEGYRQLYQLYARLQLVTRQDYALLDFAHLLETKDTATLFEYWCFFLVKETVEERLGPPVGHRPIIRTKPERQTVDRGNGGLRLDYEQNVSLWYNRWCSGVAVGLPGHELSPGDSYSHEFVPDILI